jgi:predicted nuclease with TOPRIM domain
MTCIHHTPSLGRKCVQQMQQYEANEAALKQARREHQAELEHAAQNYRGLKGELAASQREVAKGRGAVEEQQRRADELQAQVCDLACQIDRGCAAERALKVRGK